MNPNPGWLEDFDSFKLEGLDEELLDFELEDLFGDLADGLTRGGGGGVMSVDADADADADGIGVGTEVVTTVTCLVVPVVAVTEVNSDLMGAAEVSWVVMWVICTKPMYTWMFLVVSAAMTSLAAIQCL